MRRIIEHYRNHLIVRDKVLHGKRMRDCLEVHHGCVDHKFFYDSGDKFDEILARARAHIDFFIACDKEVLKDEIAKIEAERRDRERKIHQPGWIQGSHL